jgi:hypothetical protein
MTGLPDYNYPAFASMAASLRMHGFDVVCPIDLDHGDMPGEPGSKTHAEYMRLGLKALLECDAIILMQGWGNSRGARIELSVALATGAPAYTIDGEGQPLKRLV